MIIQRFFEEIIALIRREMRYKDTSTQKNLVSIIFDKKKIIGTGVNYNLQPHGSVHAEMDAFRTIQKNNQKIPKKIYVFVTRFTLINDTIHLKLSKPCMHCIKYMQSVSRMKNYTIQKIFYTDEQQNLVSTNIHHLMHEKPYISSYFRINHSPSHIFRKIHF